jgi:hypothetical protein
LTAWANRAFTPVFDGLWLRAFTHPIRALPCSDYFARSVILHRSHHETLQPRTVDAIQHTLEKAGVVFINGDQPGVRFKRG